VRRDPQDSELGPSPRLSPPLEAAPVDGAGQTSPAPRPLAGVACLVAGSLMLTLSDAGAKWLTSSYPAGEIITLRALVVLVLIAIFAASRHRLGALRAANLPKQLGRGLLACASTLLYVTGLRTMPLADAIALAFVSPMFMTAMAGPLLGERVGWRRWAAVVIGFLGVLIMLRPGSTAFQAAALFILASCLCGATRDVMTRLISRTESSLSILFFSNLVMAVCGLASIVAGWAMPGAVDLAILAVSALLIGGGHFLHIEAFRLAEIAVVAPFKYTSLLWATLFGYLIFGHFPGGSVWLGAGVIIACGLYILHRERVRARLG
jgi:drug/metabolite transporter (DMT)-like permease